MARHRAEALDDMGDPSAPVGSRPWVKAKHFHLCSAKRDVRGRVDSFGGSLMRMREYRWYAELTDKAGRPFGSLEDYCRHPEPWGLGLAPAELRVVLDEPDGAKPVPAVLATLRKRGRPRKGEEKSDAAPLPRGSNGVAYLAARLRRDEPALAERVERGELTAREAARQAGILKPKAAPPASLAEAWRKATAEEQGAFLAECGDELRTALAEMPPAKAAAFQRETVSRARLRTPGAAARR